MSVLDRVRELIVRHAPDALCDDCIARSLQLSVRQHANHKTRELASTPGFDRRVDACAIRGAVKLVIRRVGAKSVRGMTRRREQREEGQAELMTVGRDPSCSATYVIIA